MTKKLYKSRRKMVWKYIVSQYIVNQNIGLQNVSGIIEYALAIPRTNIAVEITFSSINLLWSDENIVFL
jgi:hypothetical protein